MNLERTRRGGPSGKEGAGGDDVLCRSGTTGSSPPTAVGEDGTGPTSAELLTPNPTPGDGSPESGGRGSSSPATDVEEDVTPGGGPSGEDGAGCRVNLLEQTPPTNLVVVLLALFMKENSAAAPHPTSPELLTPDLVTSEDGSRGSGGTGSSSPATDVEDDVEEDVTPRSASGTGSSAAADVPRVSGVGIAQQFFSSADTVSSPEFSDPKSSSSVGVGHWGVVFSHDLTTINDLTTTTFRALELDTRRRRRKRRMCVWRDMHGDVRYGMKWTNGDDAARGAAAGTNS